MSIALEKVKGETLIQNFVVEILKLHIMHLIVYNFDGVHVITVGNVDISM